MVWGHFYKQFNFCPIFQLNSFKYIQNNYDFLYNPTDTNIPRSEQENLSGLKVS